MISSVDLLPPVSASPPASALPVGWRFSFCAQNREYRQVPEHPLLDPDHAAQRQALVVEGLAQQRPVGGVRVQRHALVHHLLAQPRAATRLRERTAPFVGVAGVERGRQQLHQVVDRLRLEHGGVEARLDRLGIAAGDGLLRGDPADGRRVDRAPVARTGTGPAAAGAVGRPRRHREVGGGAAVIGEEAGAGRHRDDAGVGIQEPGAEDLPRGLAGGVGRVDRSAHGGGAGLRVEIGGAADEGRYGGVGLWPELGHQLGILGREAREPRGQVHGAPQGRVIEHVRRRRRTAPPHGRRDRHRGVFDVARRGDAGIGEARVAAAGADDRHPGGVGRTHLQHPRGQRLRLVAREQCRTGVLPGSAWSLERGP